MPSFGSCFREPPLFNRSRVKGGDVCVGIVARDAKGGVSKAFVKTGAGGLYLA